MKGNLLQGTARGRLGNVVARVVHGVQIYSNYQPNVINPDSPLQRKTRTLFKEVVEEFKNLRNRQKSQGYDFAYNLYSGASKTLRNILFNFAFQANEIGSNGSNHRAVKVFEPLTQANTIGNILTPFWGSVDPGNTLHPLYVADEFAPALSYFGSDVPLDISTKIYVIGTYAASPHFSITDDSNMNIVLTMVDRSTTIGIPKSNGIKESIVDCGEWNYIYSFDGSLIDSGAGALSYSATQNNIAMYVIWVDKFGRILSSVATSQIVSIP